MILLNWRHRGAPEVKGTRWENGGRFERQKKGKRADFEGPRKSLIIAAPTIDAPHDKTSVTRLT